MEEILKKYADLLARIDDWFARSMAAYPEEIACGKGCSGCCRGLFDVTLLDGLFLASGFRQLPPETRETVARKARARIDDLRRLWPEWEPPYFLNHRPEDDWEELMPDEDETPCVLLSDGGDCLLYRYRPMTCRLHGLPLVDLDGEVQHDEWCTENFVGTDPLVLEKLRDDFIGMFRDEVVLFRDLTVELLGEHVRELDLFIPSALLVGETFDWKAWWSKNCNFFLPESPPD